MPHFTFIRATAACIGLALGVGMGLSTNAVSVRQENDSIQTVESVLAAQREQIRLQELKVEGLEKEIGPLEKLADVDPDKVTEWRHAHVPEASARLFETQRELRWERDFLKVLQESLKQNERNHKIGGEQVVGGNGG